MSIPGPQELALLLFVALGAFVLRRVLNKQLSLDSPAAPRPDDVPGQNEDDGREARTGLRTATRLAIVGSVLFLMASGLVLEPWSDDPVPFLTYGLLPVCAAWGFAWALAGR
jgi:hypothetical protein